MTLWAGVPIAVGAARLGIAGMAIGVISAAVACAVWRRAGSARPTRRKTLLRRLPNAAPKRAELLSSSDSCVRRAREAPAGSRDYPISRLGSQSEMIGT